MPISTFSLAMLFLASLIAGGSPAWAGVSGSQNTAVAAQQPGRYGPYATIRRANEVANYFRDQGFNARVLPLNWSIGDPVYVVDVW